MPVSALSSFKHIVVIVQENRTPDNLFFALCTNPNACSTNPGPHQYDIQTHDWLNNHVSVGVTQPSAVALANFYDLQHTHAAFSQMCDLDPKSGACRMDGAAGISCIPASDCPPNPQFAYVDNSDGTLAPYLALATQYGWANYMFETNQGPSFPAHQFIFGGTSAPTAQDDQNGILAAENPYANAGGCDAFPVIVVQLIGPDGVEDPHDSVFPCFEHETLPDLLEGKGFTWSYFAVSANSIWAAPNAIRHICVPEHEQCAGPQWKKDVDLTPSHVLRTIAHCALRNVTWVTPTGQNSDHPGYGAGGGPSWVASIVDAIGNSPCRDGTLSYWNDTAILVVWDDWGGWYDHEPPALLRYPEGGYQLGFRVPLIVISAYTPYGYIDNGRYDFGSIARFVEYNFGIAEGDLDFADARANTDLTSFFDLSRPPRIFQSVPAKYDARHFLDDKSVPLPPDDD